MTRLIKCPVLFLLLIALAAPVLIRAGQPVAQAADLPGAPSQSLDWRLTGPTGGDVRALVIDPSDPQRLYFGTLDGQIYASTDGAESWHLLYNFNRPKLFVDRIIVDPRDSKTIYVGTHRHKDPGGFFKTTDGGATWKSSPELKDEAIHSLTQSPSNPDILVAGTSTGVFRSTDAGESWTRLPTASTPGLINVESLAIDPRNTNVVYAGTWYLPYKTSDGGQTWKSIKTGIIDDSDVFAINIDPRDPDHIIASACSGIYDTRNAGENWRKVQGIPSQSRRTRAILQHPSIAGPVFAGTTEGLWRSARGGGDGSWTLMTSRQLEVNAIAIHPRNPDTVFISTNNYGIMVSRDGGRNFSPTNNGFSTRFVNEIVSDREKPGRLYATTINTTTGGGFFFVSDDGGMTWQPSMRNMPSRVIGYSILQDDRNLNVIYLGTNLGVYHSLDRGASWAPIGAPEEPAARPTRRRGRRGAAAPPAASRPPAVASGRAAMVRRAQEALNAAGYPVGTPDGAAGPRTIAALRRFQADKNIPVSGTLDDTTLSALGLGGGIEGETNSGKLPIQVRSITDAINALAHTYGPKDGRPGILAATNAGLFRSYDPAQGWEKLSYGSGLDARTTCVSTSSQETKTIWVGTAKSGVLVTRDGGETWQKVTDIPDDAPVNTIAQDRQRPAYIYVGTKQAFYASHDGGEKWTRRGGNLPYGDFPAVIVNPQNGDEVFAGNAYEKGGGVYRSGDAGLTWARIDPRDPQLPSPHIWSLALDTSGRSRILVGSHSAGIYVALRDQSTASTTEK